MNSPFSFLSPSRLYVGAGKLSSLPMLIDSRAKTVLIVLGANSHKGSSDISEMLDRLQTKFSLTIATVPSEPTPKIIDDAVSLSQTNMPDVVIAIGGGSVLDAGKAISAMIPLNDSVKHYLEGVGTKSHPGIKIPFIAIPTTSGTGSEATKNAVISEVGASGYKKSLRHNNFIPDIALVDPVLTLRCPPFQTAVSGMDAFTQLLESFVSTNANAMTDALALKGLNLISRHLIAAYRNGDDVEARTAMALAAYLSGLTLANAGLGLVHGFASSIGGYFEIPHGVICSAVMKSCNELTIRGLKKSGNHFSLAKFAAVGRMFDDSGSKNDVYYVDSLLAHIEFLRDEMKIPKLGAYGVTLKDVSGIVALTDNKFNPVILSREEITEALELSL